MLLMVYLSKACWAFDGGSSNYYVEDRKNYAFGLSNPKLHMQHLPLSITQTSSILSVSIVVTIPTRVSNARCSVMQSRPGNPGTHTTTDPEDPGYELIEFRSSSPHQFPIHWSGNTVSTSSTTRFYIP